MIVLLLGGVRSGKSRRAVTLARRARSRPVFLATAEPRDAEMRRRALVHRRERPSSWRTVEESRRVPERLAALKPGTTVVLDCLTLWVGRMTADRLGPEAVRRRVDALCRVADDRRLRLIVVSNEVGSGVVPPTAGGRGFRDLLGEANARLARSASRVELLVAGLPVRLKPAR